MLYQTHHPLFFQFRSTFPLSSSFQEMGSVEAALKTSFRKEMALKSSPQAFLDDFWAVNLQNGSASDDFSVDELFDFSNGDGFEEEDENEKIAAGLVSSFTVSPRKQIPHLSSQSPGFNFDSGELVVPADEEKHLEWLSHFVEDSNSEYSAPFPAGAAAAVLTADSKPLPEKPPTICFKSPVPAKARSKRAFRTGGRVWCLTGSTSPSSSSTSSSSSGSFSSIDQEKPPGKKQRRKITTDYAAGGWAAQPQRRCSHCGVTKTPQWRAGPLGAKTLCNACGVRFKSGRLLPEYRPACSPTFSSDLHSNHHRKVIEMRRKKEVVGPVTKDLAPAVTGVQSF